MFPVVKLLIQLITWLISIVHRLFSLLFVKFQSDLFMVLIDLKCNIFRVIYLSLTIILYLQNHKLFSLHFVQRIEYILQTRSTDETILILIVVREWTKSPNSSIHLVVVHSDYVLVIRLRLDMKHQYLLFQSETCTVKLTSYMVIPLRVYWEGYDITLTTFVLQNSNTKYIVTNTITKL